MEMLEIMKKRMPEGLEIVKVKNRSNASQLQILFSYEGIEAVSWLQKTCVPGAENKMCDAAIHAAMLEVALKKNDMEMAKEWLEKSRASMGGV